MNAMMSPPVESPAAPEATMSPFERAVAVFVRPSQAWGGLARRTQWWFPLLIALVIQLGSIAILYERAIVPDSVERIDRMIEAELIPASEADRVLEQASGPGALAQTLVAVIITTLLMTFLLPSLLAFGVSFLLGAKLRYRAALGVFCWAGLVRIPEQFLMTGLGWFQESMQAVHVGWGAFLPVPEEPTRGHRFITGLLDSFGPFALWYLFVMALGASALSGAARKPVLAVVFGLYALLVLVFLGLGAMIPFAM